MDELRWRKNHVIPHKVISLRCLILQEIKDSSASKMFLLTQPGLLLTERFSMKILMNMPVHRETMLHSVIMQKLEKIEFDIMRL